MENELLLDAEQEIIKAYDELNHDQGWSFLYTPGKTLKSSTRFLFMGLNPGGSGDHEKVALTTEAGNAYNYEIENNWLPNGKESPLQAQVFKFYKMLEEKTHLDYKTMMDSTLAANYCPFRSASWNDLKCKKESIAFCNDLWANLLANTQISTIVCMSSIVRQHMASIITSLGGKVDKTDPPMATGWGKVTYSVTRFDIDGRELTMLSLPHLSRYRIFGRDESSAATTDIIDTVAKSLSGWRP